MRGDPYKHPTRKTSGHMIIRVTKDRAKYNELIKYCIDNNLIHSIYLKEPLNRKYNHNNGSVWVHLSKFNNCDENWSWLCKYKHSLNNYN